jgi:hypothetical protein
LGSNGSSGHEQSRPDSDKNGQWNM